MKVCAVIVTYNNLEMLRELLGDIMRQTRKPDDIVVVDNAFVAVSAETFKAEFPLVTYIAMEENGGSAGGYHEGIKEAMSRGDSIWTLDDDVHVPPDSLAMLIKGYESLSGDPATGIVRSVGHLSRSLQPVPMDIFTWRGALFCSALFRTYGLPRKDFFLYGEDLECSLRFAGQGCRFYHIPQSQCVERMRDDKRTYSLFFLKVHTYKEAFRLYYAFRNTLYIYIAYRKPREMVRFFLYGLKAMLCIAASENLPEGAHKIACMLKGAFDGVRGRLGKMA